MNEEAAKRHYEAEQATFRPRWLHCYLWAVLPRIEEHFPQHAREFKRLLWSIKARGL